MNTKHTPATSLPWATRQPAKGNIYTLTDNTPAVAVATHHHGAQAQFQNADYIAHACNAYPELVAAIREDLKGYLGDFPAGHAATKLRDLLAKLGEKV